MRITRAVAAATAAGCAFLSAGTALAANLYLTPEVGFLGGFADAIGDEDRSPLALGGKDQDWSPGAGIALGIAVPMDEIVPWDVGLPDWDLRFEIEVIGTADDFEFKGQGLSALTPLRSSLTSVGTTFGLWFDFPVSEGVSALIGRRVPFFDPVTFTIGGGPGFAWHDLSVRNLEERLDEETISFAWQVGTGFGYRLTEQVTLAATYRYTDQGEINGVLCCVSVVPGEFFDLAAVQHQVLFGARIRFFGVSSPHRWYGRW